MKLFRKIARSFGREESDQDMSEEMRLHLEQRIEEHIASGMSPSDARYAALRRFGGVEQAKELAREQRSWRGWDELSQDLRFAARSMARRPGFTVAAVLTLALGIGFVTTLFTMINGVAFARLPFEEAERIMSVGVPAARFDDFARSQESFDALAFANPLAANVRTETFAARYPSAIVSGNFFEVLRVRPTLGRGFIASDTAANAERCVVIGDALWEREFKRDATALGRAVQINGEAHTIIGVMSAGFGFPRNEQLWIPRRAGEAVSGGVVFGRLRQDMTARRAAEQFTALTVALAPPSSAPGERVAAVEVVPFAERGTKQALRVMLLAILGATFLVLLLACANVTNLILARALERRKELAVRAAMGATRARLIRQMLTETLVIGALGAVGGLALATWGTRFLWEYVQSEAALTGGAPFWVNFDVDSRVYAFVVGVALFATLFTGLAPALQASRIDLNEAMKQGGGGAGFRVSRLTRVLINGQMAFSVSLVTVAGLFLSILFAFNRKELPYDPSSILTARIALEGGRYDGPAAPRDFYERLLNQLAAAPGVTAAGLISSESLRTTPARTIEIEGETYARDLDRPSCLAEVVSPGFLDVFSLGVKEGRALSAADGATAPAVACVNTAFAERFGRGRSVVGRRFRTAAGRGNSEQPWITIVGVVPELGSVRAGQATRGPVFYRSMAQHPDRAMTVLVRARGDVGAVASTIRREVAALDPELPVFRLQTMQEIIELERIGMNAFGVLFIVCGLGALALASVGVYGVLSFSVRLRTREFGVRLALGATRRAIVGMIVRQGARQISLGIASGIALAIGCSFVVRSAFAGFEASGYDLAIYLGVAVLLTIVALSALLIPALRGSRVDPMIALRAE